MLRSPKTINSGPSSGVTVEDHCIQYYVDLQQHHRIQFIIFKLSDDFRRIMVDKIGPIGSTFEMFVEELINAERQGEGRYGVFDFQYSVRERYVSKIVFYLWIPDGIKVKQKMLYSSSVRALKQKLNGIHIELQCNDQCDLAQSHLLQKCLEKGYD